MSSRLSHCILIWLFFTKLKEVAGFGTFFVFSIIAIGIAIHISLFGSTNTKDFKEVARKIIKIGFFPIFGNMDIYSGYLTDAHFADDYSRFSCLAAEANLTDATNDDCPYRSGVIFTFVALIFYLILMNLIFMNMLTSAFSYIFYMHEYIYIYNTPNYCF